MSILSGLTIYSAAWFPLTQLVLSGGPAQAAETTAREIGAGSLPDPGQLVAGFSPARLVLSLSILGVAFLVTRLTRRLSRYLGKRRGPGRGLLKFIPLLNLAVWIVAAGLVAGLNLFGSPGWFTLLTLIAIVAITLGSYRLLQDMVGGVVLILERPFHIGDRLRIENLEGEVSHIGLRAFQLIGSDLSVSTIPNSEILKTSVTNMSRGEREAQVTIDLTLPENCDIPEARRVAREAAVLCPYTYLNKPVEVFLGPEAGDSPGLSIRVQAYVFDARYAQQLRTHVIDLTREAWKSFSEKQPSSP